MVEDAIDTLGGSGGGNGVGCRLSIDWSCAERARRHYAV